MAVTDIITFFLSAVFLIRGASRGFMNSLIGPLSIVVATILSIIYYQVTKNVIISLLIGLIGPLALSFLLRFLLQTWATATNSDIKPNYLSSMGGSILTLIWGWVFLIFVLILLSVLPPLNDTLTAVHNDVTKSSSYNRIAKPWEGLFFGTSKQNVPTASGTDVQSLSEDPRFQKILQDPEIKAEIDAHDIVKLMSNPKMMALTQQIMSDPATMKKVMSIYSSQTQPQAVKNP